MRWRWLLVMALVGCGGEAEPSYTGFSEEDVIGYWDASLTCVSGRCPALGPVAIEKSATCPRGLLMRDTTRGGSACAGEDGYTLTTDERLCIGATSECLEWVEPMELYFFAASEASERAVLATAIWPSAKARVDGKDRDVRIRMLRQQQ